MTRSFKFLEKSNLSFFSILNFYFQGGWLFFAPYLFIYCLFLSFNLDAQLLLHIFVGFHLANFSLFSIYLFQYIIDKSKKWNWNHFFFWVGIFLLFFIPGVYLEFPSDPWVHFQRIYSWRSVHYLKDFLYPLKFAYFFDWTWLEWSNPLQKRVFLDFLSSFWQTLWVYQFYLLFRRLQFDRVWSQIQMIGVLCFFGHNVFSFRYYSLSSTPLAYILYLRFMIYVLDILEGQLRLLKWLPVLFLMIIFNHTQELLFTLITTTAFIFSSAWLKLSLRSDFSTISQRISYFLNRKVVLAFFCIVAPAVVISVFGFLFLRHQSYQNSLLLRDRLFSIFPEFLANRIYLNVSRGVIYSFTHYLMVYRVWAIQSHPFQTLGIHGVVSLLFSVLWGRKYPRLALATLLPFLLLIYPPFVAIFLASTLPETGYRLFYAFPSSVMLIVGLRELGRGILRFSLLANLRLKEKIQERVVQYFVVMLCLIFGLIPQSPWRGRLWFQLHRVPPSLALVPMDTTVQWFVTHPEVQLNCVYIPDEPTRYILKAELGLSDDSGFAARLMKSEPMKSESLEERVQFIGMDAYLKKTFCGVLMPHLPEYDPVMVSKVASLAWHWDPRLANVSYHLRPIVAEMEKSLQRLGWQEVDVPPIYRFYRPPLISLKK